MLRFSRRAAENATADSSDAASNTAEDDKASPASRLRAVLHKLGPSTPPERRTTSFSESDSDLNPVFSARKSLKDVFSRAMRDSSDSLDMKNNPEKITFDSDHEGPEQSQLSDSSLPLSSQAASLQLLRQRLDLPETSSRFENSHSTVKPPIARQDLKHLLETAQATGESDVSTDTARLSSSYKREDVTEEEEGTATPPTRRSPSPTGATPSTPRRRNLFSASRGTGRQRDTFPSDDEDSTVHQATIKTPRPPGGWSTPSRAAGYSVEADDSTVPNAGQTPVPPGAWKSTPLPERKGILKDATNRLENGTEVSDVDDEPGMARAVRLVDSFGRERRFDEDGQEIEGPPPVSLASELESSMRTASVRMVDSMGNELEPASMSPDTTAELEGATGEEIVSRMISKVANSRQTLESIESRSSPQRTRRIVKQQAIPHDRILELAMESRGARIERERLQRQSHLVRAREEALSNEVKKTENTLVSPSGFNVVLSSSGHSRWLWLLLLLLNLLLIWLLYTSARAYIRHYFLTSYYDPFFPIVDPTPLQQLPFLRYTFLPSSWKAFNTHKTGQILLDLFSRLERANRHVLSFISKPLVDVVDIKLPS